MGSATYRCTGEITLPEDWSCGRELGDQAALSQRE
jgi:hypothetical protein